MPRVWIYYQTKDKTQKKFYKWINKTLGKDPVYYDKQLTENSSVQISRYLNDIGYFKSEVSTEVKEKNKKTKISYKIKPATPYHINNINYNISDTLIRSYVENIKNTLPVKTGDIYNAFTFKKERNIITEHLNNNGYYYFTKDYIFIEVDTNFSNYKADITIRIDNVFDPNTEKYIPHKQYKINNIYIYPNSSSQIITSKIDTVKLDTVQYSLSLRKQFDTDTLNFVYYNNPKIRFKTFDNIIKIHSGDFYSLKNVTQTYKALNNLKIYNLHNIYFNTVDSKNDSINLLDCNITLQKSKLNYYSIEIEGTNSSGDLGILGSFTYRNKNIFRGSETFNINIKAGTQAQSVLDDKNNNGIFNTSELGIEANLHFPRFLSPIKFKNFALEYQPKTTISIGYNMQIRSIYSRYITTATFGYNWMNNKYVQHILIPINLNSVKINPSPSFKKLLDQETNQRIKNQYTDHLIFGLDYSYIFNNQNVKTLSDFFYFKVNFQSSGNLLSAFNNTSLMTKDDNNNYHKIFGIRYAQYIKCSFDARYYHYIKDKNQLATRILIGLGFPYGNSYEMPFEKSFYAGGTNGMRGWQFRELGPGGFSNDDNLNIERIGNIQLEINAEYRFLIYNSIKGAIFSDLGNIWNSKKNETFTNGEFKFDTFYKQLALDAGFGIRFDLKFFLFRLDIAAPLRDPEYPEDERWRFNELQFTDLILNFGIGYPF